MIEDKKNVAEYGHFKKVTNPEIIKRIRNIDLDSKSLRQEEIYELCDLLEIDIDCERLYRHFKNA